MGYVGKHFLGSGLGTTVVHLYFLISLQQEVDLAGQLHQCTVVRENHDLFITSRYKDILQLVAHFLQPCVYPFFKMEPLVKDNGKKKDNAENEKKYDCSFAHLNSPDL